MRKSMLVLASIALALPGLAGEESGRTVVADGRTLLRCFSVFKTPAVVDAAGKQVPATIPVKKGALEPIHDFQSPLPEAAWRSPDFNDFEWERERIPIEEDRGSASGRGLGALHTATRNAVICVRAKFLVSDPAGARDLRLDLRYVGGVAVFLNGRELVRKHLPDGELGPGTLAERYPDDLYVEAGNMYLQKLDAKNKETFERRYRRLEGFAVPAEALRKGLNVLAVEVHRAPVNEAATKTTRTPEGGMYRVPGLWAYVALNDLRLTAAAGSALEPNVDRPKGVQVWNCLPFETLSVASFCDPGTVPVAVEIDAVRNGTFSGRFAVGSDRSIEGLKVTLSELVVEDGKARLPSGSVQLRHGRRALAAETPRPEHLFDALLLGVPAQVPAGKGKEGEAKGGAVLPVWITVTPPKDAVPGLYAGTATVEAGGLEKTVLPVRVRVHGWTLPDPIDWRVKNLNTLAPYWVAKHYGVPLWGEEHFKLIEKSYSLMAAINGRRADLDLAPGVRYWAGGCPPDNTMFQLVARKDGKGYDYDFTVIEKMLDLIAKTMKEPLPLVVNCWGDDHSKDGTVRWVNVSKQVQVLDPETGKLSYIENPPPGTEENYEFWKPILDELRKRIEKRGSTGSPPEALSPSKGGWFEQTVIGHQSYCWPANAKQVAIAKRIWPDAVYSFTAHSGTLGSSWAGVPVRYSECVWTQGRLEPRGYTRLLKPGRETNIWNSCSRDQHKDSSPLLVLLLKPEEVVMRGHDGLGYLCADFLRIEDPRRKGRYLHFEANSGGVMGTSTTSILAAGPDGPIETGRYEMFREGCQQCEAIIFLQRALDAKKLDGELAGRVNAYLDRRGTNFVNGWHHNRLASDRELFALAAEAAASLLASK